MTAPDMVSVIAAALVTHYSDSAMPADLDSPSPQWIASCDCDWEGTAANHGAAEALHAAHQARAILVALTEAGTVEWGVRTMLDMHVPYDTEEDARTLAPKSGSTVVSRLTLPWTAVAE